MDRNQPGRGGSATAAGERVTRQRLLVADALAAAGRQLTADQLYRSRAPRAGDRSRHRLSHPRDARGRRRGTPPRARRPRLRLCRLPAGPPSPHRLHASAAGSRRSTRPTSPRSRQRLARRWASRSTTRGSTSTVAARPAAPPPDAFGWSDLICGSTETWFSPVARSSGVQRRGLLRGRHRSTGGGRLRVVATTDPGRRAPRGVGGDDIALTVLLKPGARRTTSRSRQPPRPRSSGRR